MKTTMVALATATAATTASDEAKAVVIHHDGKPMRCEGYYNECLNEYDCRYETHIACDDCVFVVGVNTGDMRRGQRPFAKKNWSK